ncbi:MOSC N-terminal beta barrel domain-containing protein [Streptomyces sp. NPDC005236]|uniref:MOSC domain-containing protein n=1 Tax=Streptomyces sp. NPDC005236 TaxID=3157028 RepID=UPI0033BD8B0E
MGNAVLQSIHVHPVKAFRSKSLQEAEVEPWGLAGDRRWVLIDDGGKVVTQREQPRLALAAAETLSGGGLRLTADGREPLTVPVPEPVSTTTVEIFGDKVEAVLADTAAHDWCSAYVGAEVRLVHMDDPAARRPIDPDFALPGETVSFADGYPLLVTTLGSLDALNSLIAQGGLADEGPLPMSRFRPNVVVSGTEAWAEDDWSRISIGEVTFRVTKMCGRCVVTTTDQDTALRGKEPLRSLARHRRLGGKLMFGQNLVPENRGSLRVGDPVTVLAQPTRSHSAGAPAAGNPGAGRER